MVKRNNYRDSFESLYLLEPRLKTSMGKRSQNFLKRTDTVKSLKYSVNLFARKHYGIIAHLGLEPEDLLNVAKCLAMIFHTRYYKKQPNKKAAYYAMLRFLNQKLLVYVQKFAKKYTLKEAMDSSMDTGLWINDYCSELKLGAVQDQMEKVKTMDNLERKMSNLTSDQKRKLSNLIHANKDHNVSDLAIELCDKLNIKLPPPVTPKSRV